MGDMREERDRKEEKREERGERREERRGKRGERRETGERREKKGERGERARPYLQREHGANGMRGGSALRLDPQADAGGLGGPRRAGGAAHLAHAPLRGGATGRDGGGGRGGHHRHHAAGVQGLTTRC